MMLYKFNGKLEQRGNPVILKDPDLIEIGNNSNRVLQKRNISLILKQILNMLLLDQ